MIRTLLIGSLSMALVACADDALDESLESDAELAAVAQSPWVDDAPSPASTTSSDPWVDGSDDGDPWIDPPASPPRTAPGIPPRTPPSLPPRNPPTLPPRNPPAAPASGASRGYDFEESKEGWNKSGPPVTNTTRSTAQHASGESSLEVTFDGAGLGAVSVANPPLRAGARISMRIFVPSGARLNWIQPYFQRGPSENWEWTGTWTPIGSFRQNGWTTVTVQVPSNARTFSTLGVQFETAGQFGGKVYIDDVRF